MKLGFEIAVDQQTRTGDRTFEGVPDPNRQTVPTGQPRPYLVQNRPNLAKYPEHAQNTDFRSPELVYEFPSRLDKNAMQNLEFGRQIFLKA